MGLFDFLFNKKKQETNVVNTKNEISAKEEKAEEKEYPKLLGVTSYSRTFEEEKSIFEYIDFTVAGTSFHQKEIKQAIELQKDDNIFFDMQYSGMTNKEILEDTYDEMFFQYDGTFSNCSVVLEPDNEYDSEAIAVYIGDLMVGHVPEKGFSEGKKYIYDLLSTGKQLHLSLSVKGGKYKINRDYDKVETGEYKYGLDGQIVIRREK